MEDIRAHVECLAKIGFDIIPLKQKSPALENWAALPKKSGDEVFRQLEIWNSKNIGVRLGAHSLRNDGRVLGCVDGDIDTKDPAELENYANAWKEILSAFPDRQKPPQAITGSNPLARHAYVWVDQEVSQLVLAKSARQTPFVAGSKKKQRPLWTITLYASKGRQMVLPPSIHPDTGRNYQWEKGLPPAAAADIPPLPKSLADAATLKAEADLNKASKGPLPDFTSTKVTEARVRSLPAKIIGEVLDNVGLPDRSSGLLASASAMYHAGWTDAEVVSVLTDPSFGISAVAGARRGTNRVAQATWVWNYTCQKAKKASVLEAFDAIDQDPNSQKAAGGSSNSGGGSGGGGGQTLDRNRFGVKKTLRNVEILLGQSTEAGEKIFARNELSGTDHYTAHAPWGGRKGTELNDDDISKIRSWLSHTHRFDVAADLVRTGVLAMSVRQGFHPIREWLQTLAWDGTPRINTWLKDYLNASRPSGPCLEEMSSKFMLAAIARVMQPGVKFDNVLILEGRQGTGKSTAVEILGGREWSADGKIDVDKPVDAAMFIRGRWLVELAECLALQKKEAEAIKAFFSRSVDRVRDPYGHKMRDWPRQCVFIGTTNRSDYLNDPTGSRRFWPVLVGQTDFEGLKRDRDQLWAEAFLRWNLGETQIWLTEKADTELNELRSERGRHDILEEQINDILDKAEIQELRKSRKLTYGRIFGELLIVDQSQQGKILSRLTDVLTKLGLKPERAYPNGHKPQTVWV